MIQRPQTLYVDLDRTLIRSDMLWESFFSYFSKNIFAPVICLIKLLIGGKVSLKQYLYDHSSVEIDTLPYDPKVIQYIDAWSVEHGGEVVLLSASDHRYVTAVAAHLGRFDRAHGSQSYNLKADAKLAFIRDISGNEPFTYMGDSRHDFVIWKSADMSVLVNPGAGVVSRAHRELRTCEIIKSEENSFNSFLSAIRIHQWVKNLLLFVPLLLVGIDNWTSVGLGVMGFIAFSCIASGFYIFNDLLDVGSDRLHATKKKRPFASGALHPVAGVWCFFGLVSIAVVIALSLLPFAFIGCLLIYAITTFTYSKFLKRVPVVDILTLASLYVLRIISGGALYSIHLSNWLLTYSLFLFLFLAAVKRITEVLKSTREVIPGRGYTRNDLEFLTGVSNFSGAITVLIFCLYLDSTAAETTFRSSAFVWLLPVVQLFWVLDMQLKVSRGLVDDDPVKYVIKSKTTYLIGCVLLAIYMLTITI